MREFAILPHLLYLLTLPESQWTNKQLHHQSHYRAYILQQQSYVNPPPPPSTRPHHPHPCCTGTMSFLKVISSLLLGQPSFWIHYTQSIEIHCLNTPLLVSPHCFTAPFTGRYKSSVGPEHTHQNTQIYTGFEISLSELFLSVSVIGTNFITTEAVMMKWSTMLAPTLDHRCPNAPKLTLSYTLIYGQITLKLTTAVLWVWCKTANVA